MNKRPNSHRRGAALIFALVCLVLAGILLGIVARVAVMGIQQTRDEGRRVQASWLVESGLERAAARLAADPDYSGETWKIPPKVFGTDHGAVVQIEVETPDSAESNKKNIHVQADYPEGPVHRIRKSKQLTVTLIPHEEETSDEKEPPKSQNP